MQITTHGEHLIQIARWPRIFPINVYLVREEDGLTLIDTGMPGMVHPVRDQVKALGLPLKRILLTHAHTDHIGGLAPLHETYPDAEIMASERTARFLTGDTALEPDEAEKGKLRGGFYKVDVKIDRTLRAGDQIGSLEVIAAPGHAPDQIAFFDHRDQTMIAGDAFITRGGLAVSGVFRLIFPVPAFATWHLPTAVETARELRNWNPARLAVGHGPVLEDPLAAMDAAIREAEAKTETQRQHAS